MTEEELNNQQENKAKLIAHEKAVNAGADVTELAAKAAAEYAAPGIGGKAVDIITKTETGQKILRGAGEALASNPLNEKLLEKAEGPIKEAKPVLNSLAGSVGGNASSIGSSSGNVGKVTNGVNINSSSDANLGYNPNFKSTTINDVNNGKKIERKKPSYSLDDGIDNNSYNNSEVSNNLGNDSFNESKGEKEDGNFNIGIGSSPLLIFIILGVVASLILIFFIIQFYQISIAQDGGLNYAFIDVEHCDQVTITNGEYAGTYDLDEYVAGVIDHEVGGFNNSEVFKAFSVAVRTYLFTRSEIIDNVCYIENGSDTQAYRDTNNEAIIEAVANTTGLVLTNNEELIGTEYDAFCMISKDENYYYIKQNEQAMPVVWVEENVLRWSPVSYLTNICGTSGSGGHGRGMSQYGAYYLASVDGQNFEYILKYYYGNDTEIRSIYIGGGNAQTPVSGNGLAWPLTVMNCSSPFGYRSYLNNGKLVSGFHSGLDIAAAAGTPIYAAKSGKVIAVGTVGGGGLHWSYGNAVKIDSNDGMTIIYAHMLERPMVVVGEEVTIGQQIGKVGSTGNSTGNHLHFQIILNGTNVNPYDYLNHEGLPNTCTR